MSYYPQVNNDPYFPNNYYQDNLSSQNQYYTQQEGLNYNNQNLNPMNQYREKEVNDLKRLNNSPMYLDENFNFYPDENFDNNINIEAYNNIQKDYAKGRIGQRGYSHGYNIVTGEIYDKTLENNIPKPDYKNQFIYNAINPHFNNINLPPRKIESLKKENEKNINSNINNINYENSNNINYEYLNNNNNNKEKIECFECSSKEIPKTLPTPSNQPPKVNQEIVDENFGRVTEEERKRFNEYVEILKKREEEYYNNQQLINNNQLENINNQYEQNPNNENSQNYEEQYLNKNIKNDNYIPLNYNPNQPLYKQYPAGFNIKNHPDLFSQFVDLNKAKMNQRKNFENNEQYREYHMNKIRNNIGEGVINTKPLPQKAPKYNDIPLNRNNEEKVKRQQKYKEFLDEQINRKKEYEKKIENLTSQGQKNANIKGNVNPYREMREKKEKKNLGEVLFNPFTQKNYNIGDKSNLENNPITNPVNNYQFLDRRKISSGKFQNNGNNIIESNK